MDLLQTDQLLTKFNGNPPASASSIQELEKVSEFSLPADYAEFLRQMNGGEGFIGPDAYVIFWKVEELQELNVAYEVSEQAPGLFLFGSDGGGEAYAFDLRSEDKKIVEVPFVGMELGLARSMAPNFKTFLEKLFTS